MAVEIITSFQQICDANGDPLSGAKINVYAVTTTTPLSLFSDTGLTIGVANPIVTDSAGRHAMRYVATGSYKIVVTTSADVPLYERDNIDGRVPVGSGALAIANGGTGATSAAAAVAALGAATASEVADIAADVAALSGALSSVEKTHIATGTTAQRPASPIEGDIRRNTTVPQWEVYTSGWKYWVTEDNVGTSGTKLGLLNANKTDSGTNTFSGANTFSNAAGAAAKNTAKCFVHFSTDGSAAVTLNNSFNVTSVAVATVETINGFRLTYTTALAGSNPCVVATPRVTNATTLVTFLTSTANTTILDFVVVNSGGTAVRNNLNVHIAVFEGT